MSPDMHGQNGSRKIHTPFKRKNLWYLGVWALSCLAALGAALALTLPAATLSADTLCGLEEHTHGPDCWEQQLVCTWEPSQGQEPHIHGEDCWEVRQTLHCTIPEGHVHDASCYESPLVCASEEEEAHTHGDECYGEPVRTCTMEENHVHSEECYTPEAFLICGMEEEASEPETHAHTEQCYEPVLVCGMEEHTHDLSCFADPEATEVPDLGECTCGLLAHSHESSCYDSAGELQCGLTAHVHDDSCRIGTREFDYSDDELTMHITVEGPAVEALQLDVQAPAETEYSLFAALPDAENSENSDLLLLRCLKLLREEEPQDLARYHITAEVTVNAALLKPLTEETSLLQAQAAPEAELGVVLSVPDGSEETALFEPGTEQVPSLTLEVEQGIVAVRAGAYPNPSYTVQYYANIPRFADSGAKTWTIYDTTGGVLPSNNGANRTKQLYLDSTGTSTGKNGGDATEIYRVATTTGLTQMYSDNYFTYVNAPNTAYIDKLIDSESYVLDEVWVLKQGASPDSTEKTDWDIYSDPAHIHFTSRPERVGENVILITDETCLRLVYNCREASFTTPSTFYDYDISAGQNAEGLWRTGTAGINSESNYSPSRNGQRTWRSYQDVLAVGNANCGTGMGQYTHDGIYLNQFSGQNSGCAFGLADSLSNGQIVYNPWIAAPRLFNEGDALGKHIYSGSSLTFQRIGDTYTLDAATVSGVGTVDGLQDFFNPSPLSGTVHEHILTNDFWPLDGATDKTDPKFGAAGDNIPYLGYTNSQGNWQENRSTFPISDDGCAHNCFFGLQYAVSFTLTEDYIGPLEYCFFGDDDMWVFLDDRLVCDIGGVHSAVGEYVDLWDYLTPGQSGTHTLTFFYTERGASGSTCYMNFTLPSVSGVNIEQKTTQLRVQKNVQGQHDADEEFEFHIRFLDAKGDGVQDDYAYSRYGADGKALETDLIICDGSDFSLKDGEYLIIRHLPYGLRYQITERTAEGYSVTNMVNGVLSPGANAEGTIVQNGTNTVEFTNTRNTFGFSLQKQDPEGAPLTGAVFTLTDGDGNPVCAVEETEGSFRVVHSDEETGAASRFPVNASGIFTVSGLYPGSYTLREVIAPAGCTAMAEDVTLTIGSNGEITLSENSLVSCTGTVITVENKYSPRKLTLEKKVLNGETTRKFDFTVSYPGEDGRTVTHRLSLADGEKAAVTIPYDTTVTICEPEHKGYALTFRNGGTILESGPDGACTFRIRENVTITAVNAAGYVLPDTGGRGEKGFAVSGALLAALALLAACLRKRRDEQPI